ncbi:hypothetical protein [Bordetella genomosp. 11]|uniref:Uncharacterized protein n=1 Tax=Bordetella genomosp. 11 TaxID=1416808 RepID=A0A261UM54_9BORD|nr:hypothetical protein [Bordetella genomosp. 11]OZI62617.1 hypothetical protein CAL28_26075 [Bordetella genomosp. 11]
MQSISVFTHSYFPASLDQTERNSAIGTPRLVTGRQRSASAPPAGRREIPSIIYRFRRDEAASAYSSSVPDLRDTPQHPALAAIRHQMPTICTAGQALQWKPVPGVAETLSAVAHYARTASAEEKDAAGALLDRYLKAATGHRVDDIALFKTAIDRTLRGESPAEVLGELAESSLKLPHFNIRVDGLEEPPAKHFDSVLPSFAAGSYDHGPLGRTLLLEGGRARFAGPSQAQRVDKLREVIFALPNPPLSGEPLDGMADIFQALMALGIDI